MSDPIQIEPIIGWPAYCDEIMSRLSLEQLEVSNLKVEVSDLADELDALKAENERLRKALDRLERATRILPPEYDEPGSPFAEARAALETKP